VKNYVVIESDLKVNVFEDNRLHVCRTIPS